MFNRASREGPSRLGVVATPCQALALAKMRVNPAQSDRERMNKLRLLIGLFCGWALDWRKLRALLADKIGSRPIVGLDIPPSKHGCLEVYLDDATVEIPIAEVNQCVRQSCRYCFDMTCEFADLSVGSARSEEGWSVDKGWNQVLVRSAQGQELLDLARQKGTLEFKEVPAGNLAKLKAASLNKKRACLANLRQKTGVQNDLIYLDCNDPVVRLAEES